MDRSLILSFLSDFSTTASIGKGLFHLDELSAFFGSDI
jgi:hypothetical protein